MRYLFFDIECCDGVHMCEFGYIITDSNFKIFERDSILINPEKKFHLTNRKKSGDCLLAFTEQEYKASKNFKSHYQKIKDILEYDDQIVIAHSITNDVGFLKTACTRYDLPQLNFKLADSQLLYKVHIDDTIISIQKALEALNINLELTKHKSEDDSIAAMTIVKKICELKSKTLHELIKENEETSRKVISGEIYVKEIDIYEQGYTISQNLDTISKTKQRKFIKNFLQKALVKQPQNLKILNKKAVYMLYPRENMLDYFTHIVALIQIFTNNKCTYSTSTANINILVNVGEEVIDDVFCIEKNIDKRDIDSGKIKIMSYDEFLKMIYTTDKKLEKAFHKIFNDENKNNSSSGTIGDILNLNSLNLNQ